MLRPRIIPCLLVHERGLVKTVGFGQPKYVGDPINVVKIFNEKLVDELAVFDIDATVRNQEPNLEMISQLAAESRMPICYGGGVKTAWQAKTIIGLGVEKVAVSSAAISNPELITQMSMAVGTQSVVVVLDVRKESGGDYRIWTHNGTVKTAHRLVELAQGLERRGVGEIVVNSIDRDGMMSGYDLALARTMRNSVSVPLTIVGGAGKLDHVAELISELGVIGAGAGSLFVFKGPFKAVLPNYPAPEAHDRLVRRAIAGSPQSELAGV